MIERTEYLNRLARWKDKRVIKVITGIRRCGKSTLMELYQNYLIEGGVKPERIIAVNLEDFAFEELRESKALHSYIVERVSQEGKTYVFLDEIQMVEDFQRVVDSLFIRKNIDLYITGSNAYMLSGELATLLSGRYVTIEMLPLSFAEYVSWTGDEATFRESTCAISRRARFPMRLSLRAMLRLFRSICGESTAPWS